MPHHHSSPIYPAIPPLSSPPHHLHHQHSLTTPPLHDSWRQAGSGSWWRVPRTLPSCSTNGTTSSSHGLPRTVSSSTSTDNRYVNGIEGSKMENNGMELDWIEFLYSSLMHHFTTKAPKNTTKASQRTTKQQQNNNKSITKASINHKKPAPPQPHHRWKGKHLITKLTRRNCLSLDSSGSAGHSINVATHIPQTSSLTKSTFGWITKPRSKCKN